MNNVLEKVKKLLALANNNSSKSESENAMLMAQKILAENGLSMSDVEKQEQKKQPVNEGFTPRLSRMPWWHGQLAGVISQNFKCEFLVQYYHLNNAHTGSCIHFFGHPDDMEICRHVYLFALQQIDVLSRRYVKAYKARCYGSVNSAGIKNDYISGFICGLRDKFRKQVESNQWALAIQSDEEVRAAKKRKITGKKAKTRIHSAGSTEAKAAGYKQGKSFEPITGEISS
jgi:hypothetical protein